MVKVCCPPLMRMRTSSSVSAASFSDENDGLNFAAASSRAISVICGWSVGAAAMMPMRSVTPSAKCARRINSSVGRWRSGRVMWPARQKAQPAPHPRDVCMSMRLAKTVLRATMRETVSHCDKSATIARRITLTSAPILGQKKPARPCHSFSSSSRACIPCGDLSADSFASTASRNGGNASSASPMNATSTKSAMGIGLAVTAYPPATMMGAPMRSEGRSPTPPAFSAASMFA